jgi:dienelactone hydrolase
MRFPNQPGCLASVTVAVTSLNETMAFWRAVLHPLGYGRINEWPGSVLWAREGSQVLVQEASEPSRRIVIMLRAGSRREVDAIYATAQTEGWPVKEAPGPQFIAPGYYGCVLAVPGAEGICIAVAHAWDDLPERSDARKVRIDGADPSVLLGGYLFTPEGASSGSVIVLHGYGADANVTAHLGARLAADGWTALCLSLRGWLGSTGHEDQGLRQPDDILCAAAWLEREMGDTRVGLLGFSQGGQVALLAAARAPRFGAVVAFFPCTDLASWPHQVEGHGIAHYLDDFVAPEHIAACSPLYVADRIAVPTLLIHGDKDRLAPIAQSEALVAANPSVRLRRVSGADHGLAEQFDIVWPEAVAFINQHLAAAR